MSLKKIYLQEMHAALQATEQQQTKASFSRQHLEALPGKLQEYLQHCGYTGKQTLFNFLINYEHTGIRLKPGKNWLSLTCQQFNSSLLPTRLALMQSRLYGVVPFGARDKYQHGQGNMLIKLAGFTVNDARGAKMNQAALVTYLAETPLLPGSYLQNKISWEDVGKSALRATIQDSGNTASGEFYFNDQGEVSEFRTKDRYYSGNEKEYNNWTWSAFFERYELKNGIRVPTVVRAVWHIPGQNEYEYFRAAISEVKYNIRSTAEAER